MRVVILPIGGRDYSSGQGGDSAVPTTKNGPLTAQSKLLSTPGDRNARRPLLLASISLASSG